MAIYIDDSEGRFFVRFTSDDSRQAIEQFVAEHGLSVDWSNIIMGSTGTLNGRRFEMFRLPIVTGPVAGALPTTFASSSILLALQHELEGDGYFRVLRSDLEAGSDIQRVTFQPGPTEEDSNYVFLLSRVGTLTSHGVPAGGLAVENLLARRRQRLATTTDEVLRVAFLLGRACESFGSFGNTIRVAALKRLAASVGGPRTTETLKRQSETTLVDTAAQALLQVLEGRLRELIAGLVLDLKYRYDEAASIADAALATMIKLA